SCRCLAGLTPRAAVGLWIPRPESLDAIYIRQLRPADSACVRHACIPRTGPGHAATARRYARGSVPRRVVRPRLGRVLQAHRWRRRIRRGPPQCAAVPHNTTVSQRGVFAARNVALSARDMTLLPDLTVQGLQMFLVLLLAPLLTGFVR